MRIASPNDRYTIDDLLEIMTKLRGEGGCPWDKEQTHQSIRSNFLEETCEVLEAIDNNDPVLLREELGDVLLQVVFHTEMEREHGVFDFTDVTDELCRKLIVRHPHVFGDVTVSDSGEVLKNWDSIKKQTKGQETFSQTLERACQKPYPRSCAPRKSASAPAGQGTTLRTRRKRLLPSKPKSRSWKRRLPQMKARATLRTSWATCCFPA
ncbi:MAG: MazG family protein [Oscillospiraceae bacterium]